MEKEEEKIEKKEDEMSWWQWFTITGTMLAFSFAGCAVALALRGDPKPSQEPFCYYEFEYEPVETGRYHVEKSLATTSPEDNDRAIGYNIRTSEFIYVHTEVITEMATVTKRVIVECP